MGPCVLGQPVSRACVDELSRVASVHADVVTQAGPSSLCVGHILRTQPRLPSWTA